MAAVSTGREVDSGDEGLELFGEVDAFEGLEAAPASAEPPWIVAMDRCRRAATLPDRQEARKEQAKSMAALAELGRHKFHGDAMREAGVIDYAIETIKGLDVHDLEDRQLLLFSCRAIRRVICPNRLNRRRVRLAGGLPVLVPVLACRFEPIVLECAHAIKNTCYGHGVARNEVRELGGVHALMRVLLNPEFTNATWRAAVALCGLSWANPENRDIITTTPGVMDAIEIRLGQKSSALAAVGLKALRRHIAVRASGGELRDVPLIKSRKEANVLAVLARAEEVGEEEEEDGEEGDDDGEGGDSDDGEVEGGSV